MDRIPVAGPWITRKEIDYVTDAVTRCWYGNANEYQRRFEAAFAEHLGVRHAVSLPSCTSAIHLALAALGVGPGDEVIVPDLTWIASAAPITYVGATTVFADVDEQTWCLDARSLERCITPRTRAVIPVDLYGGVPDLGAIREIARARGIVVIEDAAQAIGSEYAGSRAGSLGEIGVFSFHGSKTLTTGEGGMLVTDDESLHENVLVLRDHGRMPGDTMFRNTRVGYKYKMSAMQAALGLAQLERIDELIERKRLIFGWYREELHGLPGIALNHEPPRTKNSYWMVTVVLDPGLGLPKEGLIQELRREGIDTRPVFDPLSSQQAYRETASVRDAARRNPASYRIGAWGVNLPSALTLTREQVTRCCHAVKSALGAARRP